MKHSLLVLSWIVLLFLKSTVSDCQTVILSEKFSGFTTGTHASPSTYDLSHSLDAKTSLPGWQGSLIYSADGEIKVGTASTTGWIETPIMDLSLSGGNCRLSFDISRWPGDASTIQVCLDGNPVGPVLSPQDDYTNIVIDITSGTSSSRIRFQALTKRFYLDNILVTADLQTSVEHIRPGEDILKIWPVPSTGELHIDNASEFEKAIITDLFGITRKVIIIDGEEKICADISTLRSGLYLVIFLSKDNREIRRIIKI